MVGVKLQVKSVLFTVALPSGVTPLKMRRFSPVVRKAEMLPLRVGVLSSVKASSASKAVMTPTLSSTAMMAAEVVGAVVSMVIAPSWRLALVFPARSLWRARMLPVS